MLDYNSLFYTCSLIEFIGRDRKLVRKDVVRYLGEDVLRRIYSHAEVFHCEPIAKTANDFIERCSIPTGDFDNVAKCRYAVPGYWDIGAVYARLIEDVADGADPIRKLMEVYASSFSDAICRFNTDLYYQSRQYLSACWRAGEIIAA